MDDALTQSQKQVRNKLQYVLDFFKEAKERSKRERRCVISGADDLHAALEKCVISFLYPDDSVW